MPTEQDPHLWLEEVTSDDALTWVRARNAESTPQTDAFKALTQSLRAILDAKEKIPYIAKHGPHYYNFWRDADHPKGLWRRTSLASYRTPSPAWELVLDIDALARQENTSWVFHGATFLEPACERCMLALSPGGSDAAVQREFDLISKSFVGDGFAIPAAKSRVSWIDADTLFVGTDTGWGSMTTSGYPRIAQRWHRGTPLEQASVVFKGAENDVSASAWHDSTLGFQRDFVTRSPTFFTTETFLLDAAGVPKKLDIPDDAQPVIHKEWLLVHLRTPWTVGQKTFAAGELLAAHFDAVVAGQRHFKALFTPTPTTSLQDITWTCDHLILNVLDDVKNRLYVLTPADGAWKTRPLLGAPSIGTVSVAAVDTDSNAFFMTVEDFVTPTSLFHGTIDAAPERLKVGPHYFDSSSLEITQHFATSKDGTRVPYFQVAPRTPAADAPTLLSGYGGFEIPLLPYYGGLVGRAWLQEGGIYVLANIRGGGEYGPTWHEAALKAKRHRAYEDFVAVADDLVRRGVTSAKRLGIQGGSNGGLLMGNMITQYPERFGAVVCEVPLLDMQRYSHLLAGASWMGEYGDPDKPEEWAFIKTFSPYHNLREGVTYPPVLFTTSTRDDRVHPGHARKMMEKMRRLGCDVHYYENIEGGHGGAADNEQAAFMRALAYTFLRERLAAAKS